MIEIVLGPVAARGSAVSPIIYLNMWRSVSHDDDLQKFWNLANEKYHDLYYAAIDHLTFDGVYHKNAQWLIGTFDDDIAVEMILRYNATVLPREYK